MPKSIQTSALPIRHADTYPMLTKVYSCAVIGLKGAIIEIEVDASNGLQVLWTSSLEPTSVFQFMERLARKLEGRTGD
jgi:hypothetical protein